MTQALRIFPNPKEKNKDTFDRKIEAGPIQFGDAYPGIFLDGKSCKLYEIYADKILEVLLDNNIQLFGDELADTLTENILRSMIRDFAQATSNHVIKDIEDYRKPCKLKVKGSGEGS